MLLPLFTLIKTGINSGPTSKRIDQIFSFLKKAYQDHSADFFHQNPAISTKDKIKERNATCRSKTYIYQPKK